MRIERASGELVMLCNADLFPSATYLSTLQDFFDRHPSHPYIVAWDKPKVAAFRTGFPSLAR